MKTKYTDQMSNKGISMIVHGDPGVGKTSLIKTLPIEECLLASVDAGEYVLGDVHCPVWPIREGSEGEFRDMVRQLHEGQHKIKYLFVDNMTELEKFFLLGLTKIGRKGRAADSPPDIKDWGDASFWMRKYVRDIRDLTYKGINVVFIFWSMAHKVSDAGGELHSLYVPMCMTKTTMEFCGLVDFVAYMGIASNGSRFLQFESDKMIRAKKRDLPGRELEKFEQPDLAAIFKKIKGGDNGNTAG